MRNSTNNSRFKNKQIVAFQSRLASYKLTLVISLDFLTLKNTTKDLETTRALENKIENATSRFAGQMQGLQIGLQTFLEANATPTQNEPQLTDTQIELAKEQESRILQAIEQQNIVLGYCYRACMAALRGTTQVTGNTYKYVSASDEVKMLVGDVGNVSGSAKHVYEDITAGGKSHVVVGNMQGEYMKDFFGK
ncbi:hypothetical protein TSTA_087470 [Talaromyces stipitatus ATCC 10500]|uniref:Azaphilone pigments biosynthesis cluster protein L N-terminal domain-containing protein n=1 Tax=Talaromyces stipitatus (strain ATCC 10500 / CBS 375.48 / QM 6759 / NRRL 1006) TaxID=441959 RepID=B8M247_TALSN|nr:uncharacterized protein TSTA_087470 [Talaromyces stipitatus ATCC 10500]EED21511.1 hypothetical protein TSTA_087470 [Talaromyces stipitatus ATCC 10500]